MTTEPMGLDDKLKSESLRTVSAFMAGLSLRRVVLVLLLMMGGVLIYAMWETRLEMAFSIRQSPSVMVALLVGMLLLGIGAALNSMQMRLDQRTDQIYRQMRDQIEDLQHQVKEHHAAMAAAELVAKVECDKRIASMQAQIDRFVRTHRDHK